MLVMVSRSEIQKKERHQKKHENSTGTMGVESFGCERGCHGYSYLTEKRVNVPMKSKHINHIHVSIIIDPPTLLLLQQHIYIYIIVIFHICMSLFESTLLSYCKPQSKLDLPTLRQGSRELKNATEQI